MHRDPLRIGILCDSNHLPLWIATTLNKLLEGQVIKIPLVAIARSTETQKGKSLLNRIVAAWRKKPIWLYELYYFTTGLFSGRSNSALAPASITTLCTDAANVSVRCVEVNEHVQIVSEDVNIMRGKNLDILLCCGIVPDNVGESDIAAHGMWYVECPSDPYMSNSATGSWKVLNGFPILTMEIRRRLASWPQPQVLCRSFLPTYVRDGLWAAHGAEDVKLWTASAWLRRLILRLYTHGPAALIEFQPTKTLEPTIEQDPQFPRNREMAVIAIRKICRKSITIIRRGNRFDEWQLAYVFGDRGTIQNLDGNAFSRMVPPKGFFWADPFPVKYKENFFIFFEELPYASGKGHLSVIQMDAKGIRKPPVNVLERPYHLSYPFVFTWNGDYYMVPETASNRTIELYKAHSFPFEWTFHKILVNDISAVDSTVELVDGIWWMFCSAMPYEELRDDNFMELHIFYAEIPLGPWTPHPLNPVKSDVRNSRPAGRLIKSNSALYRPAQDCLRTYGHAISINRVERLTKNEYRESETARILPAWFHGAKRIHTINSCENLSVVDLAFTVAYE